MGRSWNGWDSSCTDEELWEQNRGIWPLSDSSLGRETIATLSFHGRIRVVARVTGRQKFFVAGAKSGYKTALTGAVLPIGDPTRDKLVGMEVPSGRNPVQYLEDLTPNSDNELAERESKTFLMTFNPKAGSDDGVISTHGIPTPSNHNVVRGRWSTGNTSKKIRPGDRAFLLQQGDGIRGIVASGVIETFVFQDSSWKDTDNDANYVFIRWEAVVDETAALHREQLEELAPDFEWTRQASGTELPMEHAVLVEEAWAEHIGVNGAYISRRSGRGQKWSADPRKRKLAEDFGQRILERHYVDQGWEVTDTRIGNPYDAVATKSDQILYLEAKATQSSGDSLLVTPNEVTFAREHKGQCVIGVVSDIRFDPDGSLDESSGIFRIYDWTAHVSELVATGYKWKPSRSPIVNA
ncbi:MAG TPA: hypothetical protein DEB66_07725 [Micrococcaceae bacterium]|nr:hypothetical protein [Micrococcaceae bacterium]